MKGYWWFVRNYGVRALVRYERARLSGATLNYGDIFNADERALLEEHGLSMWGKRIR